METPTGQSRLAYRLAAAFLLIETAFSLVVSIVAGVATSVNFLTIDAVLAAGLIDLRRGARVWVLLRAAIGAIMGVFMLVAAVVRTGDPRATPFNAFAQFTYTASLIIILLGRSKPWRLALASGLFALALASIGLWLTPATSGAALSLNSTSVVIGIVFALAVVELTAAAIIKQVARQASIARPVMYLLAVTSVITMVWCAWLVGASSVADAAITVFLWSLAVIIIFVGDATKRRYSLYALVILGVLFCAVWLVLHFPIGGA